MGDWVGVDVVEVRRAGEGDSGRRPHVAILREQTGDRTMPIGMGQMEALALARSLEHVTTKRPLTYEFAAALVGAAGGLVREVRVTKTLDYSIYASVIIDGPSGKREVDCRPSDGLNLALVLGVPINVARDVFDDDYEHRDAWQTYPTRTAELVGEGYPL